jgi:hypothetical protein
MSLLFTPGIGGTARKETRTERHEHGRKEAAALMRKAAKERRAFAEQPEAVRRSYRFAKASLAIGVPVFAALPLFLQAYAAPVAAVCAALACFSFRKSYPRYAAVPAITILAGTIIGIVIINPFVKEFFYGGH